MKPIFEPGELLDIIQSAVYDDDAPIAVETIEAKLSSLGIDAETPEKLIELEHAYNSLLTSKLQGDRKLAELERQLAFATGLANGRLKRSEELEAALFRWESQEATRAACCMANEDRVAELERMIAEAPVVYALARDGAVTDRWYTTYHDVSGALFRARLVQIEEIKP